MDNDDYYRGKSGLPPSSNPDMASTAAWARGDLERKLEIHAKERVQYAGSSHRHTLQILVIAAVTGLSVLILNGTKTLNWETWQLATLWFGSTFVMYVILRLLPKWLSGTIMALTLGGFAGVMGWYYGDVYWSLGAGIFIGAVGYFLFSWLD